MHVCKHYTHVCTHCRHVCTHYSRTVECHIINLSPALQPVAAVPLVTSTLGFKVSQMDQHQDHEPVFNGLGSKRSHGLFGLYEERKSTTVDLGKIRAHRQGRVGLKIRY